MKWKFFQEFHKITSKHGFHVIYDENTMQPQVVCHGSLVRFDDETRVYLLLHVEQQPANHDISSKIAAQIIAMTREDTKGVLWAEMLRVRVDEDLRTVDLHHEENVVVTRYFRDFRHQQRVHLVGQISDFVLLNDQLNEYQTEREENPSEKPIHMIGYNLDEITPFGYSNRNNNTLGFYASNWSLV